MSQQHPGQQHLGQRLAGALRLVVERDEQGEPIPASELHPTLYAALQRLQTAARLALAARTDGELADALDGIARLCIGAVDAWSEGIGAPAAEPPF